MRWRIIVVAAAASACLGMARPQAGKTDQEALQGVWRVVSGEMGGKPLPDEEIKKWEAQLTIKGNMLTWKTTMEEDTGTFAIDSAKKPKHLDITAKMLNDGKVVKGIYELKGDELKICMPLAPEKGQKAVFENKRPEGFETKGKPEMMLKLKRAQ